ncbi:hypothetical protein EKK58_03180 [Candidatus Dependentiae bacterium]|nr:MAG: hypothetical protein EKK58_03180 [Candidatus Dependentiae bacterium]
MLKHFLMLSLTLVCKIHPMEKQIMFDKYSLTPALVKKYRPDFITSYKKEFIDPLFPEKLKGFVQAFIACDNTIDSNKKNHYLLYKTMQYALKTYEQIMQDPADEQLDTMMKSYQKIVTLIKFFKDNINQYQFTPHIRFNILFYLALLQDMAHKRRWYYQFDQTLCLNMYDIIPTPTEKNIALLDNFFNPILASISDAKHFIVGMHLSDLKNFYNKDNAIVLPITNEYGIIDLHILLYFLTKKYIVVGFGNTPSEAHAHQLTGIADLIVHDLFHPYLPLIANKHNIINSRLPEEYDRLRESFLVMVEKMIDITNIHYQNALLTKNNAKMVLMKKYQLILFIVLHETIYSYQFYNSTIDKARFIDALNVLFLMSDFKKLKPNNNANEEITNYFLFNTLDIFNTLCLFDNTFNQKIKTESLSIIPTKIQKNQQDITIKELKYFIKKYLIKELYIIFKSLYNNEIYKDILNKKLFPFKL